MGTKPTLSDWANEHVTSHLHPFPFENFDTLILSLCDRFELTSVLEVGGGRSPRFATDLFESANRRYSINDISQFELDRAPAVIPHSHRLCFDIAGDLPAELPSFDLVFSQSVLEHVRDTARAYANTLSLLRPGGIGFHFFPTLYSLPFVVNKILPLKLSGAIVSAIGRSEYKRFPAYYDKCTSTRRTEISIRDIGYTEVVLVPFWGHQYFQSISPLNKLERRLASWAAERDLRITTSYCIALLRR